MHIAILIHEHDQFDDPRYFLYEISKVWRSQGHRVTVRNRPGDHVDADVAILHVDLTRAPDAYVEYVRRHPVAINASVSDISKRRISNGVVRRGDGYGGRVIVKTNRNCGGDREVRLSRHATIFGRRAHWLRSKLPWTLRSALEVQDYAVFDSPRDVPRVVWLNRDLVVERFRPEERDGYYHLRTWVFFGDRETSSICYSKEPIVKSTNLIGREPLKEVPEPLRRMRHDLGFDFGKFDYGVVDGEVALYDANRTPSMGRMSGDVIMPGIRGLAEGIQAFL